MKKLFILLGTITLTVAADADVDALEAHVARLSIDDLYKQHQTVHNLFFDRLTKNPTARDKINTFLTELAQNTPLTPIDLTGMSSRTRILLIRELTAALKGGKKEIPFKLHNTDFKISLDPSLRQPGDGIVNAIGRYDEIVPVLKNNENTDQSTSKALLDARKKQPGHTTYNLDYHPQIQVANPKHNNTTVNLEILNLLFDFEVARRLQQATSSTKYAEEMNDKARSVSVSRKAWKTFQNNLTAGHDQNKTNAKIAARDEALKGLEDFYKSKKLDIKKITEEKKDDAVQRKIVLIEEDRLKFDLVPMGSAVVGMLHVSSDSTAARIPLSKFLDAPHPDGGKYTWGKYAPFSGSPKEDRRAKATREILKMFNTLSQPLDIKIAIRSKYLDVFGGESESDGDGYDSN